MPETMSNYLLNPTERQPMTEVTQAAPALERLRILVVEDCDVQKMIFLKVLFSMHNITCMASDVKEGWELYLEIAPHIVFLDIALPDGNGNDLARKIKLHNHSTHIIMATSYGNKANREKAEHNRVDGFMVKPISKVEINDHIDRFRSLRREDTTHFS